MYYNLANNAFNKADSQRVMSTVIVTLERGHRGFALLFQASSRR